jgi:predicted type IV restriction endonuclease
MDREALDRYVDRSVELVDSSPQMDEQNTRAKLVDPLVREVLGWDLYSTEVELEYPIQMGSSRTKVDYALLMEGSPAVFIEAKGCDTALTERHENQLRSYMQQQWVDWGLLTNGVVLELFKLRKSEDQPSVELLGESEVAEPRRHSWLVRTLSKESIRSGDAEGIYRSVERRRKAVSQLTQHKDEIADELLQVLSERVGDSIAREAESETKSFIDELTRSLSNGEPSGVERTSEPGSTAAESDRDRNQKLRRSSRSRTRGRRRTSTSSRSARTGAGRPIVLLHRAMQWPKPWTISSRNTN